MPEFLAWVARRPRTYAETMEAWQTNCPRNSVWEDALGDGLIHLADDVSRPTGQAAVTLTPRGRALLDGTRHAADVMSVGQSVGARSCRRQAAHCRSRGTIVSAAPDSRPSA